MQGNICQKHIMKRTITRILLTILATAFALPGLAADCSAPMPVAIAPDTIAKLKQARADINDDTFTKGFHRPSQWGQRINLSFSAVTDAGLARLAKYDQLSRLDLSYMNITDAGLQHVAKLKKLIELTLTDTPITDAGLAHLASSKSLGILRTLELAGTRITDAGLAHLKSATQLQSLDLTRCHVSATAVRKLQTALPNVHIEYGAH